VDLGGIVRGKLLLDKRDFNKALKSAGADAKRFNQELKRMSGVTTGKLIRDRNKVARNSVRASKKEKEGWWQKFGTIALGFTIAYRAMNAFESVLRKTSQTIGEAIRESGVLAETQAKLAFWFQLHSGEAVNFSEAFARAAVNVEALRKASIYSISTLEELAIGIDEISQTLGGVAPQSIEAMASVVDFTVMVAQTTGSTTRQIRQELQALMDGRIKTTDQLARSLMKVGILTKEDLKDLRAMRNQVEILDKVFKLLGERQKVVNELLRRSSVEIAYKFWEKSIRSVIIQSIKLSSELQGINNLFAQTLSDHAERFMEAFSPEDADRFVILMNTLNTILGKALTAFEETVKFVAKLATAVDNAGPKIKIFSKIVGTLLIAELAVASIKALTRAMAIFAVATTAKLILATAATLLLIGSFMTFKQEFEGSGEDFADAAKGWYREYMNWSAKMEKMIADSSVSIATFLFKVASGIGKFLAKIADETYTYWKDMFKRLFNFIISKLEFLKSVPFLGDMIEGIEALIESLEKIKEHVSFEKKKKPTGLDFSVIPKSQQDMFEKLEKEGTNYLKNIWDTYVATGKWGVKKYLQLGDLLVEGIKVTANKHLDPIKDFYTTEFLEKLMGNIRRVVGFGSEKILEMLQPLFDQIEALIQPNLSKDFWTNEMVSLRALFPLIGLGVPKGKDKVGEVDDEEKALQKRMKKIHALYVKALDVRRKADDTYFKKLHKYQEDVLTLYMSERDALIALGKARNLSAADFELMINRFDLDQFIDRYERMRDGWQDAVQSMTDYWIDFLKTGEFKFGDFITSVLEQIARLVIAEYLVDPIAKALGRLMGSFMSFGGGGGGGWTAPGAFPLYGAPGFAKGGVLSGPTYFPGANAIGGEAGKEALIPLSRLSGGKLGVGMDGMFSVNIINNTGAEIEQSESKNRRGGRDLTVVIGKALGQDIASGGPLSQSMERSYGLRRSLVGRS